MNGHYAGWGPNRGIVVPFEAADAYAARRGKPPDVLFSGNWIRVEDSDAPASAEPNADSFDFYELIQGLCDGMMHAAGRRWEDRGIV